MLDGISTFLRKAHRRRLRAGVGADATGWMGIGGGGMIIRDVGTMEPSSYNIFCPSNPVCKASPSILDFWKMSLHNERVGVFTIKNYGLRTRVVKATLHSNVLLCGETIFPLTIFGLMIYTDEVD